MSVSIGSMTLDTSFVYLGNISVSGNLNIGGNCSTFRIISDSDVNLYDGFNVGTISQVSSQMRLSSTSSGNIAFNSTQLRFIDDSSNQITAYTGSEMLDDCRLHTFIYNSTFPSTPKTILASTYHINTGNRTIARPTPGNVFACAIQLSIQQVVNGAGFYVDTSGISVGGYALYDFSYNLLAKTTVSNTFNTGMNYFDFINPYTTRYSGTYYVATLLPTTSAASLRMVSRTMFIWDDLVNDIGRNNKAFIFENIPVSDFPSTAIIASNYLSRRIHFYGVVYSNTIYV